MDLPEPLRRAISDPPPISDATPQELAMLADAMRQAAPWLLLMLRTGWGGLQIEIAEHRLQFIQPKPALRVYPPRKP